MEDNLNDAKLIEAYLKNLGFDYHLSCVETRGAFLEAIEEGSPHIILCDYQLPGYSGLSAHLDLKERGLDIPFILITGTLSDAFAAEIAKMGIKDYLLKDRLSRLPLAIKNCLQHN